MSNYFKMFLLKRKLYLEDILDHKQKAIEAAPGGRIRVGGNNGYSAYYLLEEDGDLKGKYLNKDNRDLAQALVQKDYDKRIVEAAAKELKALDKLIKLQSSSVEDIYEALASSRKTLVTPIKLPDDEYVQQWLAREYEPMAFDENDPIIESLKGLRVRSKSERLWADSFDKYGVPFLFEPPLYLEGIGWVRPDFVGLNVKMRKEIYVENLGMMDDAGYAEDNVKKIRGYEASGLYLGDRLLITMETRRNPVNTRTVEDLIKKYFL